MARGVQYCVGRRRVCSCSSTEACYLCSRCAACSVIMLSLSYSLVAALISLPICFCQRRIISGTSVKVTDGVPATSSFVVYLVEQRDDRGKMRYQDWAWMCAGAVIAPKLVLTSGACLLDIYKLKDEGKVEAADILLWVIAGTTVNERIEHTAPDWSSTDKCINKKRTVKKIYYPTELQTQFQYTPAQKWVELDIGIAEVHEAFAFNTKEPGCKYAVTKVDINYDEAYQKEGTDAVIFGWGSATTYRVNGQNENINSDELKYASVLLMDKEKCSAAWPIQFKDIIEKYMVCTNGTGRLDDTGEVVSEAASGVAPPNSIDIDGTFYMKECARRRREGDRAGPCVSDETCICPIVDGDPTRRSDDAPKSVVRNGDVYWRLDKTLANARIGNKDQMITGFCQNDHGAPLVTWVGPKLKLIGVASAYLGKMDDEIENNCRGPFTYMSAHCNGAFIKCVLSGKADTAGEPDCNLVGKNHLRIVIK